MSSASLISLRNLVVCRCRPLSVLLVALSTLSSENKVARLPISSLLGRRSSLLSFGCLAAAGVADDAKDSPLFRSTVQKTKQLTTHAMSSKAVCELVKRRLKDAGLPSRLFIKRGFSLLLC
jgi:hypothetical protein